MMPLLVRAKVVGHHHRRHEEEEEGWLHFDANFTSLIPMEEIVEHLSRVGTYLIVAGSCI